MNEGKPTEQAVANDFNLPRVEGVFLPADLPGVSIETGLKMVNGNMRLYCELLAKFLKTKRETGDELRARLEHGDTETAERIAHSIKSIAGVIGAAELSFAAEALEKSIAAGECKRWENRLENFEQCLKVVIAGLEPCLVRGTKLETSAGDLSLNRGEVQRLVKEMAGLLNSDIGRAMQLRDELQRHLVGSYLAREYKFFETYLDVFDIDGAKKCLEQLATALETA